MAKKIEITTSITNEILIFKKKQRNERKKDEERETECI